MPIPHQVTKEFFIPSDDLFLLENEITQNPDSMEQRINDLLFLFSLIDSAFEESNQAENTPRPNEDTIPNNEILSEGFDDFLENTTENESSNQSSENSESSNLINKITEPDEELSEVSFDDVENLFDSPDENEQQPERIDNSGIHSNINQTELLNILGMIQRFRSQQRLNENRNEYSN